MSKMSNLHAILTERGDLPEWPDDSDWDSPGPAVVRDDRGRGRDTPPAVAPAALYPDCDYVLYLCPACGRSHFVTVDPCPSPAAAAAEVATVDR